MAGYNTAVLTVPGNNAYSNCKFKCIVSNAIGSVTSNEAKLTIVYV